MLLAEKNSLLQLSNRLQAAAQRSQPQSSWSPSGDNHWSAQKQSPKVNQGRAQSPGFRQLKGEPFGEIIENLRTALPCRSDMKKKHKPADESDLSSSTLSGRRSALSALDLFKEDPNFKDEDYPVVSLCNEKNICDTSASKVVLQCKPSSRELKATLYSSNPIRSRK